MREELIDGIQLDLSIFLFRVPSNGKLLAFLMKNHHVRFLCRNFFRRALDIVREDVFLFAKKLQINTAIHFVESTNTISSLDTQPVPGNDAPEGYPAESRQTNRKGLRGQSCRTTGAVFR